MFMFNSWVLRRIILAFSPLNQTQTCLCLDYFTLGDGLLPGIWELWHIFGKPGTFWSQHTNDLSVNISRDRSFNFLLNPDHKKRKEYLGQGVLRVWLNLQALSLFFFFWQMTRASLMVQLPIPILGGTELNLLQPSPKALFYLSNTFS